MSVLAFHDELSVISNRNDIDPIGIFKNVELRILSAIREFYTISSYGKPWSSERYSLFRIFHLPFSVIAFSMLQHLNELYFEDEGGVWRDSALCTCLAITQLVRDIKFPN